MNREQIRDLIVENIGPAVGYADANRVADVLLDAHQADMAAAWKEGALWAAVECGAIRDVDTAWVTDHENPYWPGTCSACDAEPYGHDAFTCDGPGHERQDA